VEKKLKSKRKAKDDGSGSLAAVKGEGGDKKGKRGHASPGQSMFIVKFILTHIPSGTLSVSLSFLLRVPRLLAFDRRRRSPRDGQ
jgi:hypothetical protein